LSLPALTGCISAGGAAASASAPTGVLTADPIGGKAPNFTFIYTSISNGGADIVFNYEVGSGEGGMEIINDITPGSPIRFVSNGVQGGGDAATSFLWSVESSDPGVATINGGAPAAQITTEHVADGAMVITWDHTAGDQFDLIITYIRTNSGGSGIAYGGPQPAYFRTG